MLALLAAAHPGDPIDPANWDGYAQLAPHMLATSSLGDHHPAHRQLLLHTARYLYARGNSAASRLLCESLLEPWCWQLGPDHPDTLGSAHRLASALWALGDYQAVRQLDQDTWDRCRRVLGPDHRDTLLSAANLTADLVELGEVEPARTLGQHTLARCRQVLGPDHPTTRFLAQVAGISPSLSVADDPGVNLSTLPQ